MIMYIILIVTEKEHYCSILYLPTYFHISVCNLFWCTCMVFVLGTRPWILYQIKTS